MNARFAGALPVGTMLAVLASGASLRAQAGENLVSGVREHSVVRLRCSAAGSPTNGFIVHAGTASTAADNLLWRTYFCSHPLYAASEDEPAGSDQSTRDHKARDRESFDFNQDVYYKNRLEFSLESGWLPINIPFPFDFLLGDGYNFSGLYYTLVPVFASLRWQLGDVKGPWILRGNWDWSFTLSATAIPRGPETRYFAYIMGIRRNFVHPRWKIAPFVDGRLGLGEIDAKGPLGVDAAQGQNFTFTLNIGSGVRYNFNPRYAISAGINWMHISNLYLSEPKFLNYGINVYGPMVGIEVQLHRRRRHSEQ